MTRIIRNRILRLQIISVAYDTYSKKVKQLASDALMVNFVTQIN